MTTVLTPGVGDYGRITDVTPFTFRDGATYLEVLETIKRWVNGGLLDEINKALSEASNKYSKEIVDLFAAADERMKSYDGLADSLNKRLEEADRLAQERFAAFQAEIMAIVREKILGNHFDMFDWTVGDINDFQAWVRNIHDAYLIRGLRADDFGAMGWTVAEIEALPMTVLEMETRGRDIVRRLSGQYAYSPVTGALTHVDRIPLHVLETTLKGTTDISTMTAETLAAKTVGEINTYRVTI